MDDLTVTTCIGKNTQKIYIYTYMYTGCGCIVHGCLFRGLSSHWQCMYIIFSYPLLFCRYSREEPFTALNIDIRNQQHLFESLDAFVKGDLLEGANAYYCEKCDKKVRTCRNLMCRLIICMCLCW